MKKYKKIAYVLLIVIIAVLSVLLYANVSKGNDKNQKEKNFTELEFLESKLINLFNEMNNIQTRNYTISVSEITKQAKSQKEQSSESSSSSNSEGNSNGQNSNGETSSEQGGSSDSTSTSGSGNESQSNQKFDLKAEGVLTNTEDIKWDKVKSEIEILYASIPTITLTLYQNNINQEDVLNFNKEFDNLAIVAKQEKKKETLTELAKLYEYVPKFIQNSPENEVPKILIETKLGILKGYSKLDSKNWDEISNDTKQAIDSYSRLLTNTNVESRKQYSVNKVYVMINELQNATQVQDEAVFLIKYKNILEEMNNIL